MTSIFNLTKDPSLIEQSNNGMSRNQYEQITASRSVVGDAFPNGSINFSWSTNGSRWWIPDRTYIRMRCRLSTVGGGILDVGTGIAPAMDMMSTLFQSAEFRIAGKTVSRVSDYLPQVDAFKTRTSKSRSWIESVGESTNWWESQFHVRQNDITNLSLNTSESYQRYSKETLGFVTASTLAMNNTGLVTLGALGTGTADLRTVLKVGDIIQISLGAGVNADPAAAGGNNYGPGFYTFRIVELTSATTFRVQATDSVVLVAQPTAWYVTREVNISRQAKDFEITWCPPLSIFDVDHALPSSKCELVLNPQVASVFKIACVESQNLPKIPGTDYQFTVQDMYLYINTIEGPRYDSGQFYLDLKQHSAQSDNLSGTAFQQKQFDVSPSTKSLAICFQDKRAGTDTRYSATRFRSYVADPTNTIGSIGSDQTLLLNRYYISFAGQQLPSPDHDPAFDETNDVDYTAQTYINTLLSTGSYFDHGGSEKIDEHQRRGQIILHNFARDGTDRSTRVSVNVGFAAAADVSNARVLLFSVSSQIARVTVENGSVTDIVVEDT
jgi:hypothetical protein